MRVMANLSDKPAEALHHIAERNFLELDMDNFDKSMKDVEPSVAFAVTNVPSDEEGKNISVDITFDKMEDFSLEAIAAKLGPLRKLLGARTQLSNLLTYMDGRSGAWSSQRPGEFYPRHRCYPDT